MILITKSSSQNKAKETCRRTDWWKMKRQQNRKLAEMLKKRTSKPKYEKLKITEGQIKTEHKNNS